MSESGEMGLAQSRRLGAARLIVGLVQGLALYLLYRAGDQRVWPATEPMLFVALGLVLFFVPLIAVQGAGSMQLRTLLGWCAGAAITLALLGAYDRWRVWLPDSAPPPPGDGIVEANFPSFALFFFASAGLFIAHSLIAAGDGARQWIAPYEGYFDAAWKLGVQLALAFCFVGVFWGVLHLGAALFDLIELKFLSKLIERAWFAIPATTLATAAALHLTDVRARLVAGIRTVALVLLSWLLPLMALLAVGFLASLIFTGLEPLWKTRAATAILLTSAAALVILINAAWQNGAEEHTPPLFLRIGGSAAALALVPLVAIAAYALALRVDQHGWTDDRICAQAAIVVAACYALGYAASALRGAVLRGRWLAGVARVNVAASFVVLGVLIALFSPMADPMRISIASQMGRLHSGAIAPGKFDYDYLRWRGGRFGHDALAQLSAAAGPDAALIRARAKAALASTTRYRAELLTSEEIAAQVRVYPKDQLLPPSLLNQDWRKDGSYAVPPCLTVSGTKCEAFLAELTGAPPDQYIFIWGGDQGWNSAVLGEDDKGRWSVVGQLSWPHCKPALEALRAGQYAVVAPTPPPFRAVEAGGSRFDVEPVRPTAVCP